MKNLFNYILAIFVFVLIGSCKSDKKDTPISEGTEMSSAKVIKTLGSSANWSEWYGYNNSYLDNEGSIVLEGSQQIFLPVFAKELQGNRLVLRLKAIGNPELPYRLQVNWHDGANAYITSSSEVVSLSENEKSYSLMLMPPDNAVTGEVYLTLHGEPMGKAVIKSVVISD